MLRMQLYQDVESDDKLLTLNHTYRTVSEVSGEDKGICEMFVYSIFFFFIE
jgi:hypothetical protein